MAEQEQQLPAAKSCNSEVAARRQNDGLIDQDRAGQEKTRVTRIRGSIEPMAVMACCHDDVILRLVEWRTIIMNYRTISSGALVLALFAGSIAAFATDSAKEATHDGTVVKISGTELLMLSKDDKEHTHTLSQETTVTLDGKDCKWDELKAGLKIRVTTQEADRKAVSHIEAISTHKTFAHTQDGTVVSSTSRKLVMTGMDGKEHSCTVSTETKITCDGKVCKASDLKSRMKIRVTTKKTDEGAATVIEAIDKNTDFA